MIEERKVADSRVETVHMVRPNHLNAAAFVWRNCDAVAG